MAALRRSTAGPAWMDHDVYTGPDATAAAHRHSEQPPWNDDDAENRAGDDDFDDRNPGGSYVGDRLGRPHNNPDFPILPMQTHAGRSARSRSPTPPATHAEEEPLLIEALKWFSQLDAETIECLMKALGFDPVHAVVSEFDVLTASSVGPVIRALAVDGYSGVATPLTPVLKARLWRACCDLAADRGNFVASSYKVTGLHGEDLRSYPQQDASICTQAPPSDELTDRIASQISLALQKALPDRGPTSGAPKKRKYEGITQQGGEGADDEFTVLGREQHRTLIRNYEERRGSELPRAERPSVYQLSAVRGRLIEDTNPSTDFRIFGPYGERASRMVTMTADITVGGETKRRRLKGPGSFAEWKPCWTVFGHTMQAAEACPSGPIVAYEKKIEHLAQQYPRHWPVIAFAEENNREERWPEYRQDIDDEVRAAQQGLGRWPRFYDPMQPWAAAIHRAATDRDYWEDAVEKPIDRSNNSGQAAENASMVHRGFMPPTNIDGYAQMALTDNLGDSAIGPYQARAGGARHDPSQSALPPANSDPSRKDSMGRYTSYQGSQFCFKWCRKNACSVVCPEGRAHACEYCQGPSHRTSECVPNTPAYTFTPNGKGNKGGKGDKGGKGGKKGGKGGKGGKALAGAGKAHTGAASDTSAGR